MDTNNIINKEIDINNDIIPKSKSMWDDMIDSFAAFLDVSPGSLEAYKKILGYFFRFLVQRGISNPTDQTIYEYKKYLQESHKPNTVNLYLTVVKRFFAFTEYKRTYPDIAKYVKKERVSRSPKKDYFTKDQLSRISDISFSDTSSLKGLRDRAIYRLLTQGGLRTIEIVRANRGDLRQKDGTVLYIRGKGLRDAEDFIPLGVQTEQCILEYLSARGSVAPDEPLFKATKYKPGTNGRMTTRMIRMIVKQGFKKAGYDSPRLTAHSLRHSMVTNALKSGIDFREVQKYARHKSPATTEIYAHDINMSANPTAKVLDDI